MRAEGIAFTISSAAKSYAKLQNLLKKRSILR